jgi:SAM-dependent methyltransferase
MTLARDASAASGPRSAPDADTHLAGSPVVEATFGAGGAEPYASALRGAGDRRLYLSEVGAGVDRAGAATMDPARWSARADAADLSLLEAVRGPVLDVGCGPGRMVRAALDRGADALGIDVSTAALEVAAATGIPVLHGSVFDPLPREGEWQTVLLVDGNIGIGGDVSALLARCLELLAPDGELVVEANPAGTLDVSYRGLLTDTHGHESASFPWADIGLDGLVARASSLGLATVDEWMLDGRVFCRLTRRRALDT